MAATIITLEDLHSFKTELLYDISQLFNSGHQSKPASKWLKSKEVRQLLKISPGTLQNLRINGTLSCTRVGSIIYYAQEDIDNILKANKR